MPDHNEAVGIGINGSNTVVGFSYSGGIPHSCQWSPSAGGYSPSAIFGENSGAYAINSSGVAVGVQWVDSDQFAMLQAPGQPKQDLGDLGGSPQSKAYDINDSGWVVGSSLRTDGMAAFLWTQETGMMDLHSLVEDLPQDVRFLLAFGINSRGEIAGYTNHGPFRLVPITDSVAPLLLLLDK